MQKFFIEKEAFENKIVTGEIAYQLKNVLRAKPKDQILLGYQTKSYLAEITKITSSEVFFEVIEEISKNHELPIVVDLFQGIPKKDKLEQIIKYGTQLGVHQITPVQMDRSIVKIDEKKKVSKLERYQKIAQEAAEQSFRDIVPFIGEATTLKKIDFSAYDVKIVCYEESAKQDEVALFRKALSKMKPHQKMAVIVGPEGGITASEIAYLKEQGFLCVGLGPRILRTETVVFYLLSAVSYEWELKL